MAAIANALSPSPPTMNPHTHQQLSMGESVRIPGRPATLNAPACHPPLKRGPSSQGVPRPKVMPDPAQSYFNLASPDQRSPPTDAEQRQHYLDFQKHSDSRAFNLGRLSSITPSNSSSESADGQQSQQSTYGASARSADDPPSLGSSLNRGSFSSTVQDKSMQQPPPSLRRDLSLVSGFNQLNHGREASAATFLTGSGTCPSVPSASAANPDGTVNVDADTLRTWVIESPGQVLLLDVRTASQYTQAHIRGSLNICISGILLKRKSFNVVKLIDILQSAEDKKTLGQWTSNKCIVAYNDGPSQTADAAAPANLLKKFAEERFSGKLCILKGGFPAFARSSPSLIVDASNSPLSSGGGPTSNTSSGSSSSIPCVGGCPMPKGKNVANPFFANIRQNEELRGGIVQMAAHVPDRFSGASCGKMPEWLQHAADVREGGTRLAQAWYKIEKTEQARLMDAFGCRPATSVGPSHDHLRVEMAGIEQGTKNRYHNILPFNHSRIKLRDLQAGQGDYINASAITSSRSKKSYVATQGPLPSTFADFWSLVWEQGVRVIIMLTTIQEGPQIKCHNYWKDNQYGPWIAKFRSEELVSLKLSSSPSQSPANTTPPDAHRRRPSLGPRSKTTPTHVSSRSVSSATLPTVSESDPHVIVRRFTLYNSARPQEQRTIIQLQYDQWPDFGTPAHPSHVLGVIQRSNEFEQKLADAANNGEGEDVNSHPKLVHCSAGCGRTGTFCTIDTVIDQLRQQQRSRARATKEGKRSSREKDRWLYHDEEDLITQTIKCFRDQRLSMVQHQRQFVLCYEAVMEWLSRAKIGPESPSGSSSKSARPTLGGRGITTGGAEGRTALSR